LKRCVRCVAIYDGEDWGCPACGFAPALVDGFLAFAPEIARSDEGFDPAHFAELARLEAHNFWFRGRNRLIVWALKRYFPQVRRLLEIGCGTGFVAAGLAEAAPTLGIEASEAQIAGLAFAAQRVPRARLYQMDARAVPFAEEFDVVAAFDVIEHIEDDAAVLREMRRAARPGGGILLTVPQHPWLWSDFDARAKHVRRYTARELRDKVVAAGLEILRMTSFVSLLLPLMLLSRRAPRAGVDALAELRIAGWLNAFLGAVLACERSAIRAGLDLPVGGSLLVVARRPA
jgi:SAM-dependent methyltransferase